MSSLFSGRRRAALAIPCALILIAAILGLGALGNIARQASAVTPSSAPGLPVSFAGISASAHIREDAHGIPHISADSVPAVYAGLGWEHAHRNLFQMLLLRASGQGRAAELLGQAALPQDMAVRTMRLDTLAQQMYTHASPREKEALDAYAIGVNSYLERTPAARLSGDVRALDLVPARWQPWDSLSIANLIVFQLDVSTIKRKLTFGAIAANVSPAVALALMPEAPAQPALLSADGITQTPLQQFADAPGFSTQLAASAAQTHTPPATGPFIVDNTFPFAGAGGRASNNFVVAGTHTSTAKPILENDPHLALSWPSVFKFAELRTPLFDVTGAIIPGTSFIFSGHNTHLAWGATFEMVDPADVRVVTAGDITGRRTETFRVRGGASVNVRFADTAVGPIINDGFGLPPIPLFAVEAAVSHTDVYTVAGWYDLPFANTIDAGRTALAGVSVGLNYLLASDEGAHGRIAFQDTGALPQRSRDNLIGPVPDDAAHAWHGFAAYDQLPHLIDPPSGIIVTANNRVVGDDYPIVIGTQWDDASRAQQITRDLLRLTESGRKLSPADAASIQLDVQSPHERARAQALVAALDPTVTTTTTTTASASVSQAIDAVRGWDGRYDADSAGALSYSVWLALFTRDTALAQIGPDLYVQAYASGQFFTGQMGFAEAQLLHPTPPFFADRHALSAAVTRALQETVDALDAAGARTWGDIHTVTPNHPLAAVDSRFAVAPATLGGGPTTPDTGGWMTQMAALTVSPLTPAALRTAFAVDAHADERSIYVVGDWSRSLVMVSQGEWGDPATPHYRDGYDAYNSGKLWRLEFGQ